MYFYKKETEYGFTLFQSPNQPIDKEGLIELTEEEYTELLEEVE